MSGPQEDRSLLVQAQGRQVCHPADPHPSQSRVLRLRHWLQAP